MIGKANYPLVEDVETIRYLMSHDFKKPLRFISYSCALIRDNKLDYDSEDAKDLLLDIDISVDKMFKMIESLSKHIYLGVSKIKREDFSANDALENVINKLQEKIIASNVSITHPKLPDISWNEDNFLYIFEQLIDNSIRFIDNNQTPEINISYEEDDRCYYFMLTNNTPVIEEEFYEIIFVLFQRIHTEEEISGLGIGLAISKQMVEQNEGNMWVEEENNRNKFVFTVPK